MKKALQLASAFMGVIIGAGFASGREIVQYFTSFGIWRGTTGAVLAAALFAFLGMSLMRIGSRLRVRSHKEAVHAVSGRYLGALIDWIIVLTLFGVGVVMIAGAGSNLAQQFGVPFYAGAVLMTVLVFATALLRLDRIVRVIGSVTPFLILFIGFYIYMMTIPAGDPNQENPFGTPVFWLTVASYLALAAIFWFRRPYLLVGKDYVGTRRFSGPKTLPAGSIKSITVIGRRYVIIEPKKGGNWVFSRLTNRFPIDEMAERLRKFAQDNRVPFFEEKKQ